MLHRRTRFFGARHNASNSLRDIADLVPLLTVTARVLSHAENTILHDDELGPRSNVLLYNTGVGC